MAASFVGVDGDGDFYEVEWHHDWARVVPNQNGITGWAKVLQSTNPAKATVGSILRFHKCAHNPCSAMWPASKYGCFAPPIHVRPVENFPDPPAAPVVEEASDVEYNIAAPTFVDDILADLPDAPPAEPAVAEAPPEESAVAELTAVSEAPPAEPAVAEAPSAKALPPLTPLEPLPPLPPPGVPPPGAPPPEQPAEPAVADAPPPEALPAPQPAEALPVPQPAEAPSAPSVDGPIGVPLRTVDAAAPAETMVIDLTSDAPNASPTKTLPQSRAAANILGKLLKLAREIRTPRAYVGYSFFVLFALCKKCRPALWEGEHRVSIIEQCAPWALEQDLRSCGVEGVCCCLEARPDGNVVMVPVSEEHLLHRCRHFLGCTRVEPDKRIGGTSIQAFYHRLGVVVLGTVVDGDCGLDLACMMIGLPQTCENRSALREEPNE